jgi:hypothetical protein
MQTPTYKNTPEIYCIFKTCWIIPVVFSAKWCLFHNFIFSCSSSMFFINSTVKFKYQPSHLRVEYYVTGHWPPSRGHIIFPQVVDLKRAGFGICISHWLGTVMSPVFYLVLLWLWLWLLGIFPYKTKSSTVYTLFLLLIHWVVSSVVPIISCLMIMGKGNI